MRKTVLRLPESYVVRNFLKQRHFCLNLTLKVAGDVTEMWHPPSSKTTGTSTNWNFACKVTMPGPSAAWIKAWIETDSLWKLTVAVGVHARSLHLLIGWTEKHWIVYGHSFYLYLIPFRSPPLTVFCCSSTKHNASMLHSHLFLTKQFRWKTPNEFTYESIFTKLGRIFKTLRLICALNCQPALCRVRGYWKGYAKYKYMKMSQLNQKRQQKKLKTSVFPMFANFQWVGSSAEHSAEGMQCILKCNQICWTFFKDSTLWSHSTPLHHPLLCPIMLPSKEKRKKCSIKVIYHPAEPQHQQLVYKSRGDCYCITAKPILPEDVCCVCTAQTVIPQKNGGKWG